MTNCYSVWSDIHFLDVNFKLYFFSLHIYSKTRAETQQTMVNSESHEKS